MDLLQAKLLFREALLTWFADNQRDLPWRKGYQPYQIWISEVMAQQTQMDRVVSYFASWMDQFPDVAAVASAPEQQIFKAWEGLGYYSRVRNIQAAATLLVREHGGEIPRDYQALLSLPGIGPYTAAAIMSIAFNEPVPLIDANVERVLCRIADLEQPVKSRRVRRILEEICGQLLPEDAPRSFNQALMELGALVCRPKNPACSLCPVHQHCRALAADVVDLRPVPGKKQGKIDIVMACGIIVHHQRLYIQQRRADDVWGGLWEFPGGRIREGETPEQAARREIEEETEFQVADMQPFATVVHHYTRYRVTLHSFFATLTGSETVPVLHAASDYHWVDRSEMAAFAFPAGHRQLIEKMGRIPGGAESNSA